MATPPGISLLMVAGALAGVILLGGASAALLAIVLAFGAVALMYLVTEELLATPTKVRKAPGLQQPSFYGIKKFALSS
jgi:zinc transporter, ZIP family